MRDFLARLMGFKKISSMALPALTFKFSGITIRATSKSDLVASLSAPLILLVFSLGVTVEGMVTGDGVGAGAAFVIGCGVWAGVKCYGYLRAAVEAAWLKCEVLRAGTPLFMVSAEATSSEINWQYSRAPFHCLGLPSWRGSSFPAEHIEASLGEICDPLTAVVVCIELEEAVGREFLTWGHGKCLAPESVLT